MLSVLSSATLFFHLQSSPASESYIRWPKYWSFSFSISPSKEYSGLISFRIDWFDLLAAAAQGTLKEFPSTTIQKHQFFDTQPSLWSNLHPCITTRKTIALTIRTFVGQVMSSLFNILYLWTRPQKRGWGAEGSCKSKYKSLRRQHVCLVTGTVRRPVPLWQDQREEKEEKRSEWYHGSDLKGH